jgi:hypothetical protein
MDTIQKTLKGASGTSFFWDTIEASFNELEAILGNCDIVNDSKVSREWVREFGGILFTLYDWKMSEFGDDEAVAWHIGGYNSESTGKVKQELERLLELAEV